jgi:hypothetical protein
MDLTLLHTVAVPSNDASVLETDADGALEEDAAKASV